MKQMFTLTEMAAELERQRDAKVDYLADTRQIHFVSDEDGSEMDLPMMNDDGGAYATLDEVGGLTPQYVASGLVVNRVAHEQIATHLGIPKRYYDRLRADLPVLLDENVNRLLRHKPEKRMIRTLDRKARAFLSDSYRRLDNDDIAAHVLPILGEIPDVEIRSCALTDTRMYIKATSPHVRGTVVGDEVCAGVYVGNSEVGHGSLAVYPFVEVLACTNGMVVQREGAGMMRRVHLGRRVEADSSGRVFRAETIAADDRALLLALADVVRAAVDDVVFRDLVAAMNAAAEDEPVADPLAAVEVLAKAEALSETESRDVLRHLASGGDLSRWGMLNAVTRTAEEAESYDRATELEALGGKMLDYPTATWRAVATARG